MLLDELLALHEHPRRPTAGIVDTPFERLDHLHQKTHHAARCKVIAARSPLLTGELTEKILVDPAQNILAAALPVAQPDGAEDIDQFAQFVLIQRWTRIVFGEYALERRVLLLDGFHRIVDDFADGGLLGVGPNVRPPRCLRHPENVFGPVLVPVFGHLIA